MALRSPEKTRPAVDSQELALDLEELNRGIGSLSSQESQHFRIMLLGLNEKLKALELTQQQNKELKSSLKKAIESQEILHQSIKDSLADAERQRFQQEKQVARVTEERNSDKVELSKLQKMYRDKSNDEERLLSKYKLLQSDYDKLKAEAKNFASMNDLSLSFWHCLNSRDLNSNQYQVSSL